MNFAQDDSSQKQPGSQAQRPSAPVADRFLAFALDVCLWLPLAFIPSRPLWRKFQYHYMVSPGSIESFIQFFAASLIAVLVFIIAQTLFVWKWGATPGKQILRIAVVDLETGARPSPGASFLRACALFFEMMLAGLPALEILSHKKRRPWHDRLAETRVVTLKDIKEETPHWLEVRFFRNIYWGLAACVVFAMWTLSVNLLHRADRGVFKQKELQGEGYLCEVVKDAPVFQGLSIAEARIDFALAMYRDDRLSRECLESEADFAFWTQSTELMPWAHLVRGLLAQDDKKDKAVFEEHYLNACPVGHAGAVCDLAKWFNIGEGLEQAAASSWAGRTEKLRDHLREGKFAELRQEIAGTDWPEALAILVQDHSLRTHFLLREDEAFRALHATLKMNWSDRQKDDNAAWACWAETVNRNCADTAVRTACGELSAKIKKGAQFAAPALIALKLEARCSNRVDPQVVAEVDRQLAPMTDTVWLGETSLKRLVKIADGYSKDHWAAPYLLTEAVRAARSESDFETVAGLFQRFPRANYTWWVAYQNFEERAPAVFGGKSERGLSSVTGTPKRAAGKAESP